VWAVRRDAVVFVVGNKADDEGRWVTTEEGMDICSVSQPRLISSLHHLRLHSPLLTKAFIIWSFQALRLQVLGCEALAQVYFCKQLRGFHMEVSAKTGLSITVLFELICSRVIAGLSASRLKMRSLGKKEKRFSLLFLEDGESYARDCMGFRFHTSLYPEKRQEKGRLHICSRSLIFEPEDSETPVVRYSFRDMTESPSELYVYKGSVSDSSLRIAWEIDKVIELPDLRRPQSYNRLAFPVQQVQFESVYESVTSLENFIKRLFTINRTHVSGFDLDSEFSALLSQQEQAVRFDMTRIESMSERPAISSPILVKRIHPFMHIPGLLFITDLNLYFQPLYRVAANPVKRVEFAEITKLYRRRWRLRNVGFEVITRAGKSLLLAFETESERDGIYNLLRVSLSSECETEGSVENMTLKWQLRGISNYDYLIYLNNAAYRTFADFNQYPVFPWVIADYDSPVLDLSNPATFRDLTKPIGALNPRRLATFKKRYVDMPEPRFLYGTHYSAPGYVIGFLFRNRPLYMLRLHGGRFDSADRLFDSIPKEWRNVNENQADVKELTPEFYSLDPSFLVNSLQLDLGTKQNSEKVWDVKLPPWASSHEDFIAKMREALESDFVSEKLHHWIDLIFGYKQRGEHAFQADNCNA
jgi:factor associated with neutral sphingomyelinase activation